MDYNKIDVDAEVNAMVDAVEHGNVRPATKRESMAVRLAALDEIVHILADKRFLWRMH
jgi:hypothetical protein